MRREIGEGGDMERGRKEGEREGGEGWEISPTVMSKIGVCGII